MERPPKISVVVATYNAEKTIGTCLESVISQTYPYIELLVADGESNDRTLEILRQYEDRIHVLVSEKDRGIYDAWNKVLPRATGDWIIFLGADDLFWDERALERCAPFLAHASEEVVYGKVGIALPNGDILNFEGEPWDRIGRKFRHEMTIPHQGTFQSRKLFEKYGLFDPVFKICGDYEFLLRELKDHPARFIPDVVVSKMAFGGVSSDSRNVRRIIDELDLARRKNGLGKYSPYILARRARLATRSFIVRLFGKRFGDAIADVYRIGVGKPKLWGRLNK